MGIALGRARPVNLDDTGTLTIEFEPGASNAFSFFQSPENMNALQEILQEETDNILKARVQKVQERKPVPPPSPAAQYDMADAKPAAAGNYNSLLKESCIALVVDEFKGTIVTVQETQADQKNN
ncbi:MAG: hypothetical protein KAH38_12795 [Candidatus Hydrogenedentes bacterium]|nr:hypothetical protein [Candidatus Hydrogenedentota bacterium]